MNRTLKVVLTIAVAAAVAGGLIWSFLGHRAELAGEAEGDRPIKNTASVTQGSNGEAVVTFNRETQQRMGIETQLVAASTRRPAVIAYGHLEEDPSRSFVLRAPVAGTVQAQADRLWPGMGETLADKFIVGAIEPRFAPADRITLSDRLSAAKADVESGRASFAVAQAALNRARALNVDEKNVSDRVVQEAEGKFAAEQARLAAATRSVQLIESSLTRPRDNVMPLQLERGGQVVEVLAHPGESVESGQGILRVARFDQLFARVDVPAGEKVPFNLSAASIAPLGQEDHPIRGERIALAATVDTRTQGQPFLFRIANASQSLRPGLSVTAWLEIPGTARSGVTVPASAVVRQSGKTWVYVQIASEQFARREVVLEDAVSGGWFTRSLAAGDRIVTTGAQTLLSEEFKSQIQVGEESAQ